MDHLQAVIIFYHVYTLS